MDSPCHYRAQTAGAYLRRGFVVVGGGCSRGSRFCGPRCGRFIELARVFQPQLRFDVFAVGFDRFHAEVELLGDVAWY